MKKLFIITIISICFLFQFNLFAQTFSVIWKNTYNDGVLCNVRSLNGEPDGSFIYTGMCWIGMFYPLLKKIGSEGGEVWTRRFYNNSPNYGTISTSFDRTIDGGFILCGDNNNYPGYSDYDLHLIWTDSVGNYQRDTLLVDSAITTGINIFTLNNAHFAIVGSFRNLGSNANIFLMEVDSEGGVLWLKQYGGNDVEQANGAILTNDSCFVIAGATQSFGNGGNDVYIIKTNILGDTLWTKTYGGQSDDYGTSVNISENGGYIVTGYTNSFGSGNYDGYVLRIDESGDTLWTKIVGGENDDRFYDAVSTEYGDVIVGFTESFLPPDYSHRDVLITLIESDGVSFSNFHFLFETSPSPHETNQKSTANTILRISENEFIIGGDFYYYDTNNGDFRKAALAKVSYGTSYVEIDNNYPNAFHLYQNYPNPFNPVTSIKYSVPKISLVNLVVYDVLGKEIMTLVNEEKYPGNYTIQFDGSNLSSGVYLCVMKSDNFNETKKLILLK